MHSTHMTSISTQIQVTKLLEKEATIDLEVIKAQKDTEAVTSHDISRSAFPQAAPEAETGLGVCLMWFGDTAINYSADDRVLTLPAV